MTGGRDMASKIGSQTTTCGVRRATAASNSRRARRRCCKRRLALSSERARAARSAKRINQAPVRISEVCAPSFCGVRAPAICLCPPSASSLVLTTRSRRALTHLAPTHSLFILRLHGLAGSFSPRDLTLASSPFPPCSDRRQNRASIPLSDASA